jgi:fermentation-respiration switch protein FrsA (DUF1100 family)
MPSQSLTFESSGGHPLAARLDLPDDQVKAYAVFAHCFTCSKDSRAATFVGKALSERGIATLRFDFTGLGQSGGDFADSSFSTNVKDLLTAVNHLRLHHGAPRILIGHSLGGAAVLAAAAQVAEARAVVTIGAPSEPQHVKHLLADGIEQLETDGVAVVNIGGRSFRISREFIEDLEHQSPARVVSSLRKALLVMHAPRDGVVGIENAAEIFAMAKHPKSFVSLDDADHLLTRREDAAYAAEVIAAWASRYVGG